MRVSNSVDSALSFASPDLRCSSLIFLLFSIPSLLFLLKLNSSSRIVSCSGALRVSGEYRGKSDAEWYFGRATLTVVRQLFARRFTDRPLIASPGSWLLLLLLCDLRRTSSCAEPPAVHSGRRLPPLPDPVTQIATLVRSLQSAV